MTIETLAAMYSFGLSSSYWLTVAYVLGAERYGQLAQVQALLVLVAGILTFRTYDYYFHLRRDYLFDVPAAGRSALKVEASFAILGFLACLVVQIIVFGQARSSTVWSTPDLTEIALSFAASVAILQGAPQAILRDLARERSIAVAEIATGSAFLIGLSAAVWSRPSVLELLLIGMCCAAVKSLILVMLAWRAAMVTTSAAAPIGRTVSPSLLRVVRWLATGQLTNILKNNAIAIETILLGRVATASEVGAFRVGRSISGVMTVAANIDYQRAYRDLSRCLDGEPKLGLMRRTDRFQLKLWIVSVPVMVLIAFLFMALNESGSYSSLPFATLMVGITLLPVALQQSGFAVLAIESRFAIIGGAYISGAAMLALLVLVIGEHSTIVVFSASLFAANLLRMWIVRRSAHRLVGANEKP